MMYQKDCVSWRMGEYPRPTQVDRCQYTRWMFKGGLSAEVAGDVMNERQEQMEPVQLENEEQETR